MNYVNNCDFYLMKNFFLITAAFFFLFCEPAFAGPLDSLSDGIQRLFGGDSKSESKRGGIKSRSAISKKHSVEKSKVMGDRGVQLILGGQVNEGASKLNRAVELDEENAEAAYNLAGVYLSRGESGKAVVIMERVVKDHPDDLTYYNRLAESYIAENKTDLAIDCYTSIIEKDSSYENALFRLGSLYCLKGEYEKAEKSFRAAATLEPDNDKIQSSLGRVLAMQERYEEAVEVLKGASKLHDSPQNSFMLGQSYEGLKNYDLAKKYYSRAQELGYDKNTCQKKLHEIDLGMD